MVTQWSLGEAFDRGSSSSSFSLIQQEIVVRLLVGPQGLYLRQLSAARPPREQIARVVPWMKQNFTGGSAAFASPTLMK